MTHIVPSPSRGKVQDGGEVEIKHNIEYNTNTLGNTED